jgi:hypothetical protein
LILRRVATKSSKRFMSASFRPMGMHNSRKLQLEQATLMAWMGIGDSMVCSGLMGVMA